MHPYVALRGPTYRENSHANHTWHMNSHDTACFLVHEAPSLWVRFPSPAPLLRQRQATWGPQLPSTNDRFRAPMHFLSVIVLGIVSPVGCVFRQSITEVH
jgi:hypothetical protein